MRAAWIFAYNLIDGAVPNGLSLYMLGVGLLVGALAHSQAAVDPDGDWALNFWLLLQAANLVNAILAGVAAAKFLRGSPSLARFVRNETRTGGAVWFIHFAVAVYAAVALPLPSIRAVAGAAAPWTDLFATLAWTSLAGGALVLALLSGLSWNIRYALTGAGAALAVFGCAVGYAPRLYGWDLQPLGWYAILVASIPALAFLAMFLRRYSRAFSESRWRSRAAALALFVALFCALAIQITRAPADRFGANLQSALAADPLEIRLSDLTDFEWDAVEIYSRYTRGEDLSQDIIENTDIISRSYFSWLHETVDFVVFLKDGEIAYYEAVWRERRHEFEYPTGFDPMALRREDAVFTVRRGANRHTLTLKE